MATARLIMSKTREILRLKWERELSHRQVARALGISAGVVGTTMSRARTARLTLAELLELDDVQLVTRLYGERMMSIARAPMPAPEYISQELRRPGVTLELLHLEYLRENPGGYCYTSFCNHYRDYKQKQTPWMRQVHQAGEKTFVDYAGKKPHIVNRETGEEQEVELFVATLGASSKTFAEATETQRVADWLDSHVRAFEYFGGVTTLLVPDQLKSAVTKASAYEPLIHHTYRELGQHYGCTVVPARPAKPRDKAKVEVAVQIAERWILARLRNETFFSLGDLNRRIRELLAELNARPMKRQGGQSRDDLFDKYEREALKPLPLQRFERAEWKRARVNIDYHIEYDKHYYSVPHALLKEQVEVRATRTLIEVFFSGRRVASHRRGRPLAGHTTAPEHMPAPHRAHMEWSPSRLIDWASKVGPGTQKMVERILSERPHPEMGYRSCLGILRLEKRFGAERLEAACKRALLVGARSYQPVKAILSNGLDQAQLEQDEEKALPIHENIRGPEYFH